MSDSKTSTAAARAVARSEKKDPSKRTDREVIADVRRLLGSGLAVTPDDQRFLLTKYDDVLGLMVQNTSLLQDSTESLQNAYREIDELKALNASQSTMITELHEKLDEFRRVYELENSSQSVKVERALHAMPYGSDTIVTDVPSEGQPDSLELPKSVESVPTASPIDDMPF